MKFEKINDSLFEKNQMLNNEEMLNVKGGESTGCGQAYFANEDKYYAVCEYLAADGHIYYRKQ